MDKDKEMHALFRGAFAIFQRDLRKFLSNPFVIIMTLFMPIMYLIIFGNAMGGTITGIPLGVVQEDPYVHETLLYETGTSMLETFHQQGHPALFRITVFPDETSAQNALHERQISAFVVFPSNISPGREVRLYVDSSEYMIPTLVQSGVQSSLAMTGATNPLKILTLYGTIEYIQFFGVGVIVMAIFMTTMMGGGIALIRDREMGINEGYLVTPVKRSSIILGTIGSGTVRAFLAGFVIFLVDVLIAGVVIRSIESFILVIFVLLLICVGITSLVVALSSRFSSQQEYASSVAFLNLLFFMTSGAFYPVLGMPYWLKWLTVINPEYYAIDALRSIVLRGQGIDVIAIDLVAIAVFTILAIILGIMTYRRTLE
ncbi:MAG: ABC transporter permease [Methanoregulaceae archaeon]|jgi:ABC-2 type transport system permease protein